MKAFQCGAMEIVEALQDSSLPRPSGKATISYVMEDLKVCKWFSTEDAVATAKALMLESLQDVFLEKEDLGNCKVCGNSFLQISPKRKKKFCSTRCRKEDWGKHGSNNERT